LIYPKFGADLINTSKVTSRKTICNRNKEKCLHRIISRMCWLLTGFQLLFAVSADASSDFGGVCEADSEPVTKGLTAMDRHSKNGAIAVPMPVTHIWHPQNDRSIHQL